MRSSLFLILFAAVSVMALAAQTSADPLPTTATAKLLPGRIGDFVATGAARPLIGFQSGDFNETGEASRDYLAFTGQRISITVVTTSSDSSAYALLTELANSYPRYAKESGGAAQTPRMANVGTVSYLFSDCLFFYKGRAYVVVSEMDERRKHPDGLITLARAFADSLEKGEGEIPALVKHLPDWQTNLQVVRYAVNAKTLERVLRDQPVLDAVGFEGGTEAVAANYGSAQLVIVEFNTPQLAGDNDRRITAKIQELRTQGHSVPTAYRRVGNYSVFVFHASNEQTASQLIDQVKYQQVVQWLGNPRDNLAERTREFTDTTLGVFVSVVKASGLALVLCFAVGGFFGALLFSRRRARQTANEAYTDAGGMLRLNIDEMTTASHTSRLIGPGNG